MKRFQPQNSLLFTSIEEQSEQNLSGLTFNLCSAEYFMAKFSDISNYVDL